MNKWTKVLWLALLLTILAIPVAALTTRYCEFTYINDCLQEQYCEYYSNSRFVGSVRVTYQCP